jgi:hypothetical protein
MRKLTFILLYLFFSSILNAQPYETNPDFNRTRNWHFGYGTGLFFTLDSIFQVPSNFNTSEASSVHSDINGNLLLYSNGEKIWNANHEIIPNGILSLGHNSSNLGSVFVFHEDNPDNIYLFNTNFNQSTNKEFSINLILFEEDTFRVIFKDSVVLNNVCEPIAVVKADNGKDLWIIVHEFGTNNLYSYLLTEKGITSCPVVSQSFSTPIGSPHAAFFSMVFSSDGKYMARTNTNQDFSITKRVELYSFHLGNGKLQFLYSLESVNYFVRGLRFSGDNKRLYVVERDSGVSIFKFNPIDSLETVRSLKKITLNGNSFSIQNMPYHFGTALSRLDTFTYMDFILHDVNSDTIVILEKKIDLNSFATGVAFPNFNQSYFHTPSINFTTKLSCVENIIQFYGQDTFDANNHNWEINKQGGSVMTANVKNPYIEFEDTGVYEIRYIASNGSRSDTLTKEIIILPKIEKDFLGNDTGWCENIETSLVVQSPEEMHCYEWSTGETTSQITVDTTGIYWVKMTTPNFCVIYDTIILTLDSVPAKPLIYQENDTLRTDATTKGYQWYRNDVLMGNMPYLKISDTGIYQLKITTTGGCEVYSDTLHVYRVGIAELHEQNNIKIYPNPFDNKLFIEVEEKADLELTNNIGQVLLKEIVSNNKILDTQHLNQGIYFIKVITPNGTIYNYKLVKQPMN